MLEEDPLASPASLTGLSEGDGGEEDEFMSFFLRSSCSNFS